MSKSATLEVDTRTVAASRAVAALPMYDLPELKPTTDAFWHAIAERLEVPLSTVVDAYKRAESIQGIESRSIPERSRTGPDR